MCNKSIFRCRVLGVLRFLNTCLLSPAWFKRSLSHPLVVKELSLTLIVLYINGKAELYNVPSLNCHRKVSYPSFGSFSENRNETKAWEYLGVVRGNGRPWEWFPGSTSSYESVAVVIAHRMHNITTKSIEPPSIQIVDGVKSNWDRSILNRYRLFIYKSIGTCYWIVCIVGASNTKPIWVIGDIINNYRRISNSRSFIYKYNYCQLGQRSC